MPFGRRGGNAPPANFKVAVLTGTTGAAQGSIVSVVHGLVNTSIVGFTIAVEFLSDRWVPQGPNPQVGAGYDYNGWLSTNTFDVKLSPANSGNLLSKPIKITVFYTP